MTGETRAGRRRSSKEKGLKAAVAPREAVMRLLRAPLFARFCVAGSEAGGQRRLAAVRTQWADVCAADST